MADHSLRSFDERRHYPADVAGYQCRCPSGKSSTMRFMSALLFLKFKCLRLSAFVCG